MVRKAKLKWEISPSDEYPPYVPEGARRKRKSSHEKHMDLLRSIHSRGNPRLGRHHYSKADIAQMQERDRKRRKKDRIIGCVLNAALGLSIAGAIIGAIVCIVN